MSRRSPQPTIWVLPNRRMPGLVAVLIAMWYAGASQGNGAAYLLCFSLGALALVSIVHTWTNLRGVALEADHISPTFAGEDLAVGVVVASTERRHFGLKLTAPPGRRSTHVGTVEPSQSRRVELPMTTKRRGRFEELIVQLRSAYPLGFFTAQQDRMLRQTYYVYPAPRGDLPLPRALAPTRQPRDGTRLEGDDYGGVRSWQPGESQRHIDWKAVARGQSLLTKQWTGEADEIHQLDWQALGVADSEARLSQLAKWVVLAERGPTAYALRLPGKAIPAGHGDAHYHACLRALAEFTEPPAPPSV